MAPRGFVVGFSLVVWLMSGLYAQPTLAAETTAPAAATTEVKSGEKSGDRVWIDVPRSHLRSGPGTEFESVTIVSAGQELEVVQIQDDWLKVRASNGKEGWLSRRAVTTTPPTPVVVKSLERKMAALQGENDELTRELRRLADGRQDLELESSKLKGEVIVLQAQNEELKSWRVWVWGLLGLLVMLTGWGLGFVTGTLRRQADDKRYEALMRDAGNRKL